MDISIGKKEEITNNNSSDGNKKHDFEDAVVLTGFGKFNIGLLFLVSGCLIGVVTETISMSFILPSAQCDLDLSVGSKGLVSAICFIGVVTGSPVWGYVADKYGRKKILTTTLLSCFVCTLASSFSKPLWLFILLRYCSGFLIAAPSAVAFVYIGEFHDSYHRTKVVAWASSSVSVGTLSLPALAWLFIPMGLELNLGYMVFRSWRLLLIVCGLPSLITGLGLLFAPESPKYQSAEGKDEAALRTLRSMYSINTGHSKDSYPVKALKSSVERNIQSTNSSVKEALKKFWKNVAPIIAYPSGLKTLMLCALQFGAFFSSSGFFMWFPDILNNMEKFQDEHPNGTYSVCKVMNERYAGHAADEGGNADGDESLECDDTVDTFVFVVLLGLSALFVVGYVGLGFIINLIGKKILLVVLFFVNGVCGITVAFASAYWLVLMLFAGFLTCAICVGIVNTFTVDLYSTHHRAMAMALSLMAGRIGAIAGTNTVGNLMKESCYLTFGVFGGELILCAVIAVFLKDPRKIKTDSKETSDDIEKV